MGDSLGARAALDIGDFKSGLNQINDDMRVLNSEFKASSAVLGDWSKSATGLEDRISFLNQAIDLQKQRVQALKGQMQAMKDEGKLTASAEADMTVKINNATAELNKMTKEVNDDQAALDGMKSASSGAGNAVATMGEKTAETTTQLETMQTGWAALLSGLQVGIGVLLAVVGAIVAVTGAVAGLVFATANASAELTDMSVKTGLSTQALQEYKYVANQVGTTLETITGSQAKLVRGMASAQDEQKKYNEALRAWDGSKAAPQLGAMAQAFKDLGVQTTDAGGSLRNTDDVFRDAIDALGRIQNPAERDALAMQIFGKSAQELNPLIKAGSAELAQLTKNAHDMGAVMSDEDVAAGAEFMDTVDSLKDGFAGITGTLASQLIPLFQFLAEQLRKVFTSTEFKAGLAAAVEGLKQFSTWAITNIPLIIQQVQNMMPVIVGVLAAIGAAIIAFVYTVVIPSAVASITAMAPIIAAMLPIIAIVAAIGIAVGLLYAAWTNNWGGIQQTLTAVWAAVQPVLAAIANFLVAVVGAALQALSAYWTGVLLPAMTAVSSWMSANLLPLLTALGGLIGAVLGAYLRTFAALWAGVLYPALQKVWQFLSASVLPIFNSISDFINTNMLPAIAAFGDKLNGPLSDAFQWLTDKVTAIIGFLTDLKKMFESIVPPSWFTGTGTKDPLPTSGLGGALSQMRREVNLALGGLTLAPGLAGNAGGRQNAQGSQAREEHFHFINYGTLNFATDAVGGLKDEMLSASRY